jgi:hypothetical protein
VGGPIVVRVEPRPGVVRVDHVETHRRFLRRLHHVGRQDRHRADTRRRAAHEIASVQHR